MAMQRLAAIAASLAFLVGTAALAQDETASAPTAQQQVLLAKARAFWDSLDRQTGKITLGSELVTLDVPDDFYFLGPRDAERVLVDLWGNPPGDKPLGMLLPADRTPFDGDAWAVLIEYTDDGHVSDADAAGIDYGKLLTEMQQDARDSNPERVKEGYEPIELVGWAEPPHYDASTRKLYWAKELRFGDNPDTTLNYEIRALGRTGTLDMTFIADADQLAEINDKREAVLSMGQFNQGNRYEDFDSSIDKVAAYGIGALIAGKVAAKAGLFAAGLLLLKKFGVLLLVGLAAIGRKIKSVFGQNPSAS